MSQELHIAIIQSMPLAVIIIVLIFAKDIKRLLQDMTIHSVTITGILLKLDNSDVKKTADYMHRAMDRLLKKEQWTVFSTILSSYDKSDPKIVTEVLAWNLVRENEGTGPGADDDSVEYLKTLRALRGIGLIRPEDNGTWNNESRIIVTEFGRYLANHDQYKKLLKINT